MYNNILSNFRVFTIKPYLTGYTNEPPFDVQTATIVAVSTFNWNCVFKASRGLMSRVSIETVYVWDPE